MIEGSPKYLAQLIAITQRRVDSQASPIQVFCRLEWNQKLSPNGHGILDQETIVPRKKTTMGNFSNFSLAVVMVGVPEKEKTGPEEAISGPKQEILTQKRENTQELIEKLVERES